MSHVSCNTNTNTNTNTNNHFLSKTKGELDGISSNLDLQKLSDNQLTDHLHSTSSKVPTFSA